MINEYGLYITYYEKVREAIQSQMLETLPGAEWLYPDLLSKIKSDVFIAHFYKQSGGSASTQLPGPRETLKISAFLSLAQSRSSFSLRGWYLICMF